MVDDTPFSPDWVSPPGATIATILEERGATPIELARWIERSPDDVEDLLVGRAEITADVARRLASVLGASEAFWTRRESQYRADLARLQQEAVAARKRRVAERDPGEGHRALGVAQHRSPTRRPRQRRASSSSACRASGRGERFTATPWRPLTGHRQPISRNRERSPRGFARARSRRPRSNAGRGIPNASGASSLPCAN